MHTLRRWSIRRARALEWLYARFDSVLTFLHPLWEKIGYARLEKPAVFIERGFKGLMFDCRMCGHCVLSSTGMSCPMNCPKQMRNGPCGGVRADGACEVKPDMPCVWVAAYEGSRSMRRSDKIMHLQPPLDWTTTGVSSWLREARREKGVEAGRR